MMMNIKQKLCLLALGLGITAVAHTNSILPMKHVIANTTKDEMFYSFRFMGNRGCDSKAAVSPGHVKQVNCENGGVFKPGVYVLDFEQVYFFGKRKVRCSASKSVRIGDKKLLIWKLSKRCQLDVIET